MPATPPDPAPEPAHGTAPDDTTRPPRRVRIIPGGPLLIEGPVEIELDDGRTIVSDRFLVALCQCRRSRTQPFCDTSHRRRARTT
ncbi:CDGSH iron-sulfur domain-containing protein [Spirillospora albida]|uniref:CDGSH iron-sulfur domain-containing protein n=1 Tax=Spirillospora albida TaxID=58123 RepID=UPI0005642F0C